ncbi:uncharacterized protein LOC110106611 [Dendrobium catenatum]|uniref:uncharacterized protein LOC110106611 n=1 Tax=Dendrobium catenatum TaxID=906689 RepID=UPI0009F35076|nr:uncharacterized protein LOC110106611 [Dendrobium catenatum]
MDRSTTGLTHSPCPVHFCISMWLIKTHFGPQLLENLYKQPGQRFQNFTDRNFINWKEGMWRVRLQQQQQQQHQAGYNKKKNYSKGPGRKNYSVQIPNVVRSSMKMRHVTNCSVLNDVVVLDSPLDDKLFLMS